MYLELDNDQAFDRYGYEINHILNRMKEYAHSEKTAEDQKTADFDKKIQEKFADLLSYGTQDAIEDYVAKHIDINNFTRKTIHETS